MKERERGRKRIGKLVSEERRGLVSIRGNRMPVVRSTIPEEGSIFLAVMVPQGSLYALLDVRFMVPFIHSSGWQHVGRPF
jgi:hypothetical protein